MSEKKNPGHYDNPLCIEGGSCDDIVWLAIVVVVSCFILRCLT